MNKDAVMAGVLGAAVNFPWELAHSFLYRGVAGFTPWQHLLCCGLAALADGVGMATIYLAGRWAFRDARWTGRVSAPKLLFAALLGLAGAVAAEVLALRLGWWGYGPAMPRLPGTDLGLSPLAQFTLLPLLVLFGILPRLGTREMTP